MLKQIDYLYHFTKNVESLKEIFRYGFKPSYAKEMLADMSILVPMISFSNVLLRDVGDTEVLNYGGFAVCLSRDWGISNEINPVVYTYEKGLLYNALNTFLYNSVFLSRLNEFKPTLKKFSDCKCGPFSKQISLTNTSKEAMDILDYLSLNYTDELVDILSNHAKTIHDTNLPILTLTKPYRVINSEGKEFVAYNDREWRKLYPELKLFFESEKEYDEWNKKAKPHFNDKEYLLKFVLEDVKAILVKSEEDIDEISKELKKLFGEKLLAVIDSRSLFIGTKEMLEKDNF